MPYGDVAALAAAVTDTAAVVLEPIQGEAGVMVPPEGYLAGARRITARAGRPALVDEVQTGIGRTGRWFAAPADRDRARHRHAGQGAWRRDPASGPASVSATRRAARAGQHGTTFGGNPVAARPRWRCSTPSSATGLLDATPSARPGTRLDGLDPRWSTSRAARACSIGLTLTGRASAAVAAAAREAGFILINATPGRMRLAPPLVVTDAQVDAFLAACPRSSRGAEPGSVVMTARPRRAATGGTAQVRPVGTCSATTT